MILAIDPGNIESAYVILDENLKPIVFGKLENEKLINIVGVQAQIQKHVVIENIASYGMAVGKEIFETCIWIGRFTERAKMVGKDVDYIYRKEEKINLCYSMKAKDSNIRKALIDRFAKHDLKNGKGTKKNPDVFYGFAKDMWAAMAVGTTYYDLYISKH